MKILTHPNAQHVTKRERPLRDKPYILLGWNGNPVIISYYGAYFTDDGSWQSFQGWTNEGVETYLNGGSWRDFTGTVELITEE